jgi:hypothetical protein
MRQIFFSDRSVCVELFLATTQSSLKKQNGEYLSNTLHKWIFASVPKSPTQMGSLSVYNSVTNISRLGTFKQKYLFFPAKCNFFKEKKEKINKNSP